MISRIYCDGKRGLKFRLHEDMVYSLFGQGDKDKYLSLILKPENKKAVYIQRSGQIVIDGHLVIPRVLRFSGGNYFVSIPPMFIKKLKLKSPMEFDVCPYDLKKFDGKERVK